MTGLRWILNRIESLQVWRSGNEIAPHKPLLILYALGELTCDREVIAFRDVDVELTKLLNEFGPRRRHARTHDPFLRLQSDGLWEVEPEFPGRAIGDITKLDLLKEDATGRFPFEVLRVLKSDQKNIGIVARAVLRKYFDRACHRDILDAVGLQHEFTLDLPWRDWEFRAKVLRAYESRCCVCGYDIRLGNELAGLDAAHIMQRDAGGPDEEPNGLSLCALHHRAFEMGAFTLKDDRATIACSQELSGTTHTDWLLGFHGSKIKDPQSRAYRPEATYLQWHRSNVFKGPERDLLHEA